MKNTIFRLLLVFFFIAPLPNQTSAQALKRELGFTTVRFRLIEPAGFDGILAPLKIHPTIRYTVKSKLFGFRINAGVDYRNHDLSFLPSSHYFIRGIRGPIFTLSVGPQLHLEKKRISGHVFADMNMIWENYRYLYDAGAFYKPNCFLMAINLGLGFKYRFDNRYALGVDFYSPVPFHNPKDCFDYSPFISSGIIISKEF